MNKLSRLFGRRLERIVRREARRNAHINGLLDVKIVEIGGHVCGRRKGNDLLDEHPG